MHLRKIFAYLASPRTNANNLALGKPAQQISTYRQGVASKAVDGVRDGDYYHGSCSHTLLSKKPWWKLDLGKQVSSKFAFLKGKFSVV